MNERDDLYGAMPRTASNTTPMSRAEIDEALRRQVEQDEDDERITMPSPPPLDVVG